MNATDTVNPIGFTKTVTATDKVNPTGYKGVPPELHQCFSNRSLSTDLLVGRDTWCDPAVPDSAIPTRKIDLPGLIRPAKFVMRVPLSMIAWCPHMWESLVALLAVMYLQGIHGRTTDLPVSRKTCEYFGVRRQAIYRGLKSLEKARIITLTRKKGLAPRVSILAPEEYRTPDEESAIVQGIRKSYTITCQCCGIIFTASRKHARFCSSTCRCRISRAKRRASK